MPFSFVYDGRKIIGFGKEDFALINKSTIKLNDKEEYVLIVRGDINGDGKVTLTDLSKLILHYNETRGFILTGSSLKSADMNYDKKVLLFCDNGVAKIRL